MPIDQMLYIYYHILLHVLPVYRLELKMHVRDNQTPKWVKRVSKNPIYHKQLALGHFLRVFPLQRLRHDKVDISKLKFVPLKNYLLYRGSAPSLLLWFLLAPLPARSRLHLQHEQPLHNLHFLVHLHLHLHRQRLILLLLRLLLQHHYWRLSQ